MGFLRNLFGPSQEEIWQQLATEIGATFVDGGRWKGDKVQAQIKQWTVTIDTYTVSTGKTHMTFTRFRAPYVNADGFRFKIYRRSFFSGMGKALGMQDVEIGEPQFDEAFIRNGYYCFIGLDGAEGIILCWYIQIGKNVIGSGFPDIRKSYNTHS